MQNPTIPSSCPHLPTWLPKSVRHYLDHTATGLPLRELARRNGVSASTVLRQVRNCETRRDDPLVDAALEFAPQCCLADRGWDTPNR